MLDEAEWWLHHALLQRKDQDVLSNMFTIYPHLKIGNHAREQKEGHQFTEYDGKINIDHTKLDPRKNHELIVSSSRLELLGKCPYAYFLKYVLRIEAPEKIKYTPDQWLNSAQRGTLLHAIFERFYRECKRREEKRSLK
jgi:ATP-dependent helicase/DNAse subunit B